MEKLILTNLSLEDLAAELAVKVLDIQKQTYQQKELLHSDEYLTVEEASKIINLKVSTIYTLTCRKKIPYFKRGKKIYFRKSELEEWISQGKKCPVPEKTVSSMFLRNKRK